MKTNKIFLLVAFTFSQLIINAQSDYKQAIGIRLNAHVAYDVLAASYKNFLSDHGALEFNLGFGGKNMYVPNSGGQTSFSPGISITGAYQYHELIETPTNESLRWFAGGGLTIFNIFSKNDFYEGFGAGVFGTAGIDYKFKDSPINLTADWRPTVFLSAPSSFAPLQIGTLGIAARYTF
ncbi:MAG TPA: hypothetical protein PKE30_15100 [Niabella sp.]|nr:hypothetical protein [Niabella sp.]